jgi:hypothetical protein
MRTPNVPARRSRTEAAAEPPKKRPSRRARKGNSHTRLTRGELEQMLLARTPGKPKSGSGALE